MSEKRNLSRAELVRQRRAQRMTKELEQTSRRAVKPVMPVISRAVTSKPKQVENNRRFDVALGMPEIHLHKPNIHLPRIRANGRLVSVFMAIFLGAVIYLVLALPYFHVPAATVLGNNRMSREEIEAVLGVTGQSIFTIQPEEVATRLRMNYPELLSAKVNVYLPNHVYVTVAERQPVILWQKGDGYTWVDSSGVAFRPRGTVSGLINVTGLTEPPAGVAPLDDPLSPPPYMQKELVDAILALAPTVPAGSTMVFDPSYGLGWSDGRGWQAFFGMSARDMPLKVRVYQSLVDSLVSRGKVPEFISVVYPDAPFYRMAQTEIKETTIDSGQE